MAEKIIYDMVFFILFHFIVFQDPCLTQTFSVNKIYKRAHLFNRPPPSLPHTSKTTPVTAATWDLSLWKNGMKEF